MRALDPLQNMPKEPKLGESEKINNDNKDYKNQTIDLSTVKEQLLGDLYGINKENGQEEYNNKQEKKEIPNKIIKNNIYYPIFERLFDTKQISVNVFDNLKIQLLDGKPNLGKIDFENKQEKQLLRKVIDQINDIEENDSKGNLEDFLKDFKEISNKIDKKECKGLEEELYYKIGKNYIKIETGDEELDKKENLSTAIKTTTNQILNNYKSIPVDSVTYKVALKNIDSKNPDKQLKGLHSLYLLAVTNEGVSGSKMEKNKRAVTEGIKMRKKVLVKKYQENIIQLQRIEKANNKELYLNLLEEQNNIIDEATEIDNGIFGGNKQLETNEGDIGKTISENK